MNNRRLPPRRLFTAYFLCQRHYYCLRYHAFITIRASDRYLRHEYCFTHIDAILGFSFQAFPAIAYMLPPRQLIFLDDIQAASY